MVVEMSLSSRGVGTSAASAGDAQVWDALSNLWHPVTNPDGYVSLGVAENSLMHNELREFVNSKRLVDQQAKAFTYGDGPSGSAPVKQVIAKFITSHFNSVKDVQPEHLMITNGVTTAIEHCSYAIADPGEGVLLGRPYYRAFIPDIGMRTGVKVVPVSFGDVNPCGQECVTKYEEALLESNKNGVTIRALMLCHPHNPLGRCYSKDAIVDLMRLCQKYKVHLISDEIYALSVWKNSIDKLRTNPIAFESVLSIDTTGIIDSSLVHVLWGMSKDFGSNGIRIGVIISQANSGFLAACRACSLYSSPSSLSENAVIEILGDEDFVKPYLRTNQDRLSVAYTYAVRLLERHDIEHMPGANSAFFLWVNLGKKYLQKLRQDGIEQQRLEHPDTAKIFDILMGNKVFVVHGDITGAEEPGWFRLVFSQSPEIIHQGIQRIAASLSPEIVCKAQK